MYSYKVRWRWIRPYQIPEWDIRTVHVDNEMSVLWLLRWWWCNQWRFDHCPEYRARTFFEIFFIP